MLSALSSKVQDNDLIVLMLSWPAKTRVIAKMLKDLAPPARSWLPREMTRRWLCFRQHSRPEDCLCWHPHWISGPRQVHILTQEAVKLCEEVYN